MSEGWKSGKGYKAPENSHIVAGPLLACAKCAHRNGEHANDVALRARAFVNDTFCYDCRVCCTHCPRCGHEATDHLEAIHLRDKGVLLTYDCEDCDGCKRNAAHDDDHRAFLVGETIPGYCCGNFSFDTAEQQLRVEAVGADWLVLRADNGSIHFYSGDHTALRRDAAITLLDRERR